MAVGKQHGGHVDPFTRCPFDREPPTVDRRADLVDDNAPDVSGLGRATRRLRTVDRRRLLVD